jgi:hypothetical protein
LKNLVHRLALYTATILVSALPFTMEYADASEKTKNQESTVANNEVVSTQEQRKVKHKGQSSPET